ncbi:MAG: glycosyltransferase family 2 protein [Pseudoruegeria sp.]
MSSILIVTTVRDEGPFLIDWIAHHRALGVTDFLIYSNDCSDGTHVLLDRLQDAGILHHVPQLVARNKTPQWQALKSAWDHPLRLAADWIIVMDCDEYISLADHVPDLDALIAGCPDNMDALALAWRFFGNNSVQHFVDVPVTTQFTRAAPEPCPFPLNASFFKTLVRNGSRLQKLGVHRPKFKNKTRHGQSVWVDGSARPLPPRYSENDGPISLLGLTDHTELVRMNHYSLRSAQSFLIKRARGLPNHTEREIDLAYWVERNFNTEEDSRITNAFERADVDRKYILSLPGVNDAHVAAVDHHQRAIDQILKDPDIIYFYSRLLLAPSTPTLSHETAASVFDLHRKAAVEAQKTSHHKSRSE